MTDPTMTGGTQFLQEWNLQFQAELLQNFQARVRKAEAGRCKPQKALETQQRKTPLGPGKQSEPRGPSWRPLGLKVPTVVPAALR